MKKVALSLINFGLIVLSLTGCGKTQQTLHHSGPHPQTINFSVVSDQKVYNSGGTVKLTVSIKNVMNKSLKIKSEPHVLVGSIMDSTNKYISVPLSAFKNQTLKPNQTLKQQVSWKQKGRTGWYQTQMDYNDPNYGEIIGGGSRFFVSNPNVWVGTIEPNATIMNLPSDLKNHNSALIIKRIDFSKQYTKVFYEIKTDKKMTTYYQMSLNRSNEVNDPFSLEEQRKHICNDITGSFSFNPTLKSVNQLSVILSNWEFGTNKGDFLSHGKWAKNISIKDVK